MEDFGYSKQQDETRNTNIIKRAFLIGATLFSVACFVYITIQAYYFVYKDQNNNIETIKAAADPLKVVENDKDNPDTIKIDSSIYEDIFGNKKANREKEIKIREYTQAAIPPKEEIAKTPTNSTNLSSTTAVNTTNQESQKIIVYSDNNKKTDRNFLNTQNTKIEDKKEIASTPPNSTSIKAGNNKTEKKSIRVQIAALTSKNSANDYYNNLQNKYTTLFSGLKPHIEQVDLGKRGIFYRLQIGNFYDQVKAEEFCNRYVMQTKKARADCIIVE